MTPKGGTAAALTAALCAAVVVAGCSTDHSPPPVASGEQPLLTLSFTQLLPYEGTERGLLRVQNDAAEPVEITGIGLDWPGFGPAFREDKQVTLGAGRTMTLKLTLPEPVCAETDDPVAATVETAGRTVRQPLTASGQRFLRHLWDQQCWARFVEERLDIAYDDAWSQRGPDARPRATGTLRLTRVAGQEPVELLGVQGSVLYGLELTGATRLGPEEEALAAPVAILPGDRCDEHARGQATAPFTFRLTLRIGDAPPGKVLIPPPPLGQVAATTVLDRACGPL
jgi:hypothetical protein